MGNEAAFTAIGDIIYDTLKAFNRAMQQHLRL